MRRPRSGWYRNVELYRARGHEAVPEHPDWFSFVRLARWGGSVSSRAVGTPVTLKRPVIPEGPLPSEASHGSTAVRLVVAGGRAAAIWTNRHNMNFPARAQACSKPTVKILLYRRSGGLELQALCKVESSIVAKNSGTKCRRVRIQFPEAYAASMFDCGGAGLETAIPWWQPAR